MTNVLNTQRVTLITPAAIKQGDQAAFLTVYNDLHIKVFRFFLKRVFTDDAAKDLTQQTFIRLWQFRQTLSEQHTLEKQVFVIAHSLLINHFEKETYQKKVKLRQIQIGQTQSVYPGTYSSFELSDQVRTAIDTLPPVRKKILILKTFHEYNNREIADQMKISVKTVEDHITKAFRRMKEMMMFILFVFFSFLFLG
ncbi:MAG: sigma-70 family RNA polymerase sigma factor [Bacteroidota bacterium]